MAVQSFSFQLLLFLKSTICSLLVHPHPFCLSLIPFCFVSSSLSYPTSFHQIEEIDLAREEGKMPQPPSTRWCPTPEQLMILEEMYRSGIRTPNASQIQQITTHLSYYGKIEGKNVFYWFQNHKARDRQKMRRRFSRHQQILQNQHQINGQTNHPQMFQMDLSNPPLLPQHQLTYNQPNQFLHQGNYQEETPAMNLVYKLETRTNREGESSGMESPTSSVSPFWKAPLKTLDLFPTNTTGLREEYCSTSKSSSCSTNSTTN